MTHTITAISVQIRNPSRVNVAVDGGYRLSLDVYQVVELGIKVGQELTEVDLLALEHASNFGKLYARSLEYALVRPRSLKEMREYLWRKTRPAAVRSRRTGELFERAGVSEDTAKAVLARLVEKGYVNDTQFARYWVENRQQRNGISQRKLVAELRAKGIGNDLISETIQNSTRDEVSELQKILLKKRARYSDQNKLIAYLLRQGFSYEQVNAALHTSDVGE